MTKAKKLKPEFLPGGAKRQVILDKAVDILDTRPGQVQDIIF
jgi:hypothetical protein